MQLWNSNPRQRNVSSLSDGLEAQATNGTDRGRPIDFHRALRLVSYASVLRRAEGGSKQAHAPYEIKESDLQSLLRSLLWMIPFDERQYFEANPDLANAVAEGRSDLKALNHFVHHGYFEGRRLSSNFSYADFDETVRNELPDDYYRSLSSASADVLSNRYGEAKDTLVFLTRRYPADTRAQKLLAQCYTRLGELRRAYDCLLGIPLEKLSTEDLKVLNSLCQSLNFPEDAAHYLQRAADRSTSSDHVLLGNLAGLHLHLGNLSQARMAYSRLDTTRLGGDGLAAMRRADELYREARDRLRTLISQSRHETLTMAGAAEITFNLARVGFPKIADRRLNTLVKKLRYNTNVESTDIAVHICEAARLCRGTDRAIKVAELLGGRGNDLRAALTQAQALYQAHHYDRCLRLIQTLPQSELPSDGFRCAVDATLMLGRPEEALKLCVEWKARFPEAGARAGTTMKVLFDLGALREIQINSSPSTGSAGEETLSPLIPQQIVQYWNDDTAPPDVEAAMQSWKINNEGFSYHRFNDTTAAETLKAVHGIEAYETFQVCIHPAMKADYFRLGFLLAFGGVYVDADERSIMPLALALRGFEGKALLVVRDNWMALRNTPMICAPGHRVIAAAFQVASEAILMSYNGARNPNLWQSTGPGLITSVFIDAILDGDRLDDAAILNRDDCSLFSREETFDYKASPERNWRLT